MKTKFANYGSLFFLLSVIAIGFVLFSGVSFLSAFFVSPKTDAYDYKESFVLLQTSELPKCKAVIGNSFALLHPPESSFTYLCRIVEMPYNNLYTKNQYCALELLSQCDEQIVLDDVEFIFITTSSPGNRLGYEEPKDIGPRLSSLDMRVYRTIYFEYYDVYIYHKNNKYEKVTFKVRTSSEIDNPLWDARPWCFLYTPEPQKGEFPIWPSKEELLFLRDQSPILEMNNGLMRGRPEYFWINNADIFLSAMKHEQRMKYDIYYTRIKELTIKSDDSLGPSFWLINLQSPDLP
ncbi:MAG: hypothetical protein II295_06225 [Akkermansia sp.]|nr:hypothetical protein [Akkermansia sp.]